MNISWEKENGEASLIVIDGSKEIGLNMLGRSGVVEPQLDYESMSEADNVEYETESKY